MTRPWSRPRKCRFPAQSWASPCPHAGYPYSGPTAAYAYKAVSDLHPKTVVILGPSHHVGFSEFAVYARGAWKTPLGTVNIDEEFAAELMKQTGLAKDLPRAHDREHSIEVQVPFLQKVLKDFRIVPIEIAFSDYAQLQELAKALAATAKGKEVLFVASSDLYHGESYQDCKRTDSVTLSYLESFDPRGPVRRPSVRVCCGLRRAAHHGAHAHAQGTRGDWRAGPASDQL